MSDSINKSYEKSPNKIISDAHILDFRIAKITPELIARIQSAIGSNFPHSVFRPRSDLAMLLFKETNKSPSIYTLNLLTLRPTANSPNKVIINLSEFFECIC
jgi:hypothetical protein